MQKVFVVWCYDDGVLEVFPNLTLALVHRGLLHSRGFYDQEDIMITEKEVHIDESI